MRIRVTHWTRWAFLFSILLGTAGCVAAAAGAAGAAAGIYLTDQGAASTVDAPVPEVTQRTRAVFAEMGIQIHEMETESGDDEEVEIHGTTENLEIHVEIEPEGVGASQVNVSARKNAVQWDKEYAQTLLRRIVTRS